MSCPIERILRQVLLSSANELETELLAGVLELSSLEVLSVNELKAGLFAGELELFSPEVISELPKIMSKSLYKDLGTICLACSISRPSTVL